MNGTATRSRLGRNVVALGLVSLLTDMSSGKVKVNVNLPLALVNVGLKMGARFAPGLEGMDSDELMEAIRAGTQGKIVDVEDAEDGEKVEVYIE